MERGCQTLHHRLDDAQRLAGERQKIAGILEQAAGTDATLACASSAR